ncbi:MAG: hypothetical protein HY898_18450 [Deltaproteobacteria bacterium]|nr:hypothetical protein [Deltaproteobacteria bacterium]
MGPESPPRAPLADWPIQGVMRFGYIWYTTPFAIVTQSAVEHMTLKDAQEITSRIDRIIAACRQEMHREGGAVILHDWRLVRTYDPHARQHLFSRNSERQPGDVRATIINVTLTPVLRMAIETGNALLRITTGRVVEVVPSIGPSLGKYGVERPTASTRIPGLGKD